MSKTRVYELAKDFGMKGPEMAKLLRQLGFEKVKSHMAVLDTADEMLVVARLEAQGLKRKAAVADEEPAPTGLKKKKTADTLKKKSLPKKPLTKKALPKKALPSQEEAPEPEAEVAPEPAAEPETARPEAEAPAEPPAAAPTETAPEPPAEPPAETPAETPAEQPEPTVAAESEMQEPVAEEAAEAPAEAEQPAAEEERVPAMEPETEAAPAAKQQAEAEAGGEPSEPVKRLLVPKAKAQVVGRIELPQETIRDATRRSAPATERSAADRDLRRMALQKTQSRTATRPSGPRRGPGGGMRGGGRDGGRQGRKPKTSASPTPTIDPNKVVEIEAPVSLKALSEALGVKVTDLIATLTFKLGLAGKTINSFLSPEEVELVALELNRKVQIVEHREAEEELIEQIVQRASVEESETRAPVITFMGHVDHGKTTLLDALRKSDIARGESGGITQHIGAYKVKTEDGHEFVILDTPGHAAFTSMRARGATITDIVILVVAADDGVMPQTEEAINHAKAAEVPIVVAVNKCDAPGANPMQVRQQLAVKGLQPEEWGGTTGMVDVSALTRQGLKELVERIMLEAEILELGARPTAAGRGVVVESKQTPEQGVVVNVLVTEGTLRVKDQVVCGESFSRVRGMIDDHGRPAEQAGPSTPVTLLGLDKLPMPGDKLFVVSDSRKAREVVEDRQRRARDVSLAERSAVTLETLSAKLAEKDIQEIKVILKADVMGSLEPLKKCLDDLATEEVRVNLVHSGLGGISETDVSLAEASSAVIIGFNSTADLAARQAAERAGVEIRHYDVIYELLDDMKEAMEGLLAPEELETVIGQAEVRAVFKSSKFGTIAGCYVTDGVARRNAKVRLSRDGKVLHTGKVGSLRRIKDDVREVRSGFECGLTLANYQDIKEGDQLEFLEVQLIKRSLA